MDHSETKYLPRVDHAPAELDDASKILLKAAALIEESGWCQNAMFDKGRMCALGAIGTAGRYQQSAYDARDRLQSALHAGVGAWNDVDGRTKDEVVAKLRAVALGL